MPPSNFFNVITGYQKMTECQFNELIDLLILGILGLVCLVWGFSLFRQRSTLLKWPVWVFGVGLFWVVALDSVLDTHAREFRSLWTYWPLIIFYLVSLVGLTVIPFLMFRTRYMVILNTSKHKFFEVFSEAGKAAGLELSKIKTDESEGDIVSVWSILPSGPKIGTSTHGKEDYQIAASILIRGKGEREKGFRFLAEFSERIKRIKMTAKIAGGTGLILFSLVCFWIYYALVVGYCVK